MAKNSRPSAILLLICALLLVGGILLFQSLRQKRAASPATRETTPAARQSATPKTAASMTAASVPSHPPGSNAADIYKNAYVLYNELLKGLTWEEHRMLLDPSREVDAEKAAALFAKIQPIMELLRTSKDAGYCDWGFTIRDVSSTEPHMTAMTAVALLAKLARWNAAYRFATEPEGAVADISIQSQMRSNVANQGIIGQMVSNSLDACTWPIISTNSGALNASALAAALELARSSNPWDDLDEAFNLEREILLNTAASSSDPKKWKQFWKLLEPAHDGKSGTPPPVDEFINAAKWVAGVDKDFSAKARLSDMEFNAWWNQVEVEAKSNPTAAMILPQLPLVRDSIRLTSVNRSLLTAGLTILQSGQSALTTVPDPTTGQPFTCVPTPDGFELRSTFQYNGKPVTMKFTTPAPKP